jgi:hypothetical protein
MTSLTGVASVSAGGGPASRAQPFDRLLANFRRPGRRGRRRGRTGLAELIRADAGFDLATIADRGAIWRH